MNARETLQKYGLRTDVKSIRERLEFFIKNYVEPHDLKGRQTNPADLELLCELALKGEQALTELEQIKARAEETIGVVAKYGTSLLSMLPMTPILFVNTINFIINGDSK